MCAIKINHNGISVETDTAEEAMSVLAAITGVKKVGSYARKNGVPVSGYVKRARKEIGVVLPTTFGSMKRIRGKRTSNPWTERELRILWDSREMTRKEASKNEELLSRHNRSAVRKMFDKVKFNRPQLVGREVARIIAGFHTPESSRFGL